MNVLITNLPFVFSEADLQSLLEPYCLIVNMRLIKSSKSGAGRGIAFVEVKDNFQGLFLIDALDGLVIGGGRSAWQRALNLKFLAARSTKENH